MTSQIVFTGITGLLGRYFLNFEHPNYEIIGLCNRKLQTDPKSFYKIDITKEKLQDFIKKVSPEIIVHAASLGNVDYCEIYPKEAYKINVEGTRKIVEAAKQVGAKIIYLSTNAIYDGANPPYDEESKHNPIDIYGKTKLEGEKLIKKSNLEFVILRLITMYGWPYLGRRNNPVTWMIENLKRGKRINVVNDIYNNHLWANQAAETVWKVVKEDIKNDVFNIGGRDCISRYDLALKVAKVFKFDSSLITSVTSDFFKNIAKRPKDTCFNTKKIEKKLGLKPLSIDKGLTLMKEELVL